ncbi:MAG: DNA polymerase I [Bacteroidetes bacterium]|nr:MAG: DNA polymerase I [Bacteroidota bacterium]
MPKQKLFLLDAMALLYRAHFAFIRAPRITSNGLNTSAIFGFTNTLLEIINKEDPSHLAVAFDTSAPTFRHARYEPYKAQREAQPEDLTVAIPYAYKLLKILNIPALKLDGYEADDIIGTISAQVDPEQFDVYMVTPDKDYAQLVKENVFLYKPAYKGGGYDVLGPAEIQAKFGLPPAQIVDFLGLKGDTVDNIPGIPKIGDKTAVMLLEEFGSVEEIIARADEIRRKAIRESVQAHAEQGLLSKELATIKLDVPIEYSLDQLKMGHCDLEELMVLMQELEFRTTAQRILNSRLNPVRPEAQKDLFGNATGEAPLVPAPDIPESGGPRTIENTEHDYQLLADAAARKAFIQRIEAEGKVCFDTETTSLDPLQAELVGMSFALKAGEAFFVHIPGEMPQAEVAAIVAEFAPVLTSPDILKIGQNLKYDALVLRKYGVVVQGPMFDTMLAHYIVDPGGKHGMDAMALELLNYQTVSIETLIGKKGKNQKTMREAELEPLLEYACEDADITLQLYEKLAPQVQGNRVFEEIEQPLLPVLADMEAEGIRLDDEALAAYSKELEARLVTLEAECYQLAGEEFNLNSPKQLGEILFDKLDMGKGTKQKKTKTGQYVTDENTLLRLARNHELPDRVLAYRGIKKLKSTYVDALPKLINPDTGRVHTTYSQSVAVTGRLSSVNPNLQNIPIRTEDGRAVRKGFIPRDADHVLLSADYSQVELRIMAAMSGDEAMLEAFRAGEDIHRASAARVFGVAPAEVTPEQRASAKTVNFGIIYGISAFGLADRMNISRTEAKDIIDTYWEKYPAIKAYMDQCIETARSQGYVETYFGRRRYLPDIQSRNQTLRGFAERNAINSPIQGTAADIIKLAMIRIHRALQEAGLRTRMILQVHDELVFDVPKDELDTVTELVRTHMVQAVDLGVPMEVEIGTGANWLEAH